MRPTRPFPYFSKMNRIANNTPRRQESWERICEESEAFDLEFDKWQGNARAELQIKPEIKPIAALNIGSLIDSIKKEFEERTGQIFDNEGEPLLKTLIYYCFDSDLLGFENPMFEKSNLLIRTVFGNETTIKKDKGLFIVGGFGTGKTKICETVSSFVFNSLHRNVIDINGHTRPLYDYTGFYFGLKILTAHNIRAAKEANNGIYEIALGTKRLIIDDLFTEDKSFGREVMTEFLEERYSQGLQTHIICNYQGDSIESTLTAFGERYGSRLFDRAFEMFNFVEVKGKSLRK